MLHVNGFVGVMACLLGCLWVQADTPAPPVITSFYPIAGTADASVSVEIYTLPTTDGLPTLLDAVQADAAGHFQSAADVTSFARQFLSATAVLGDQRSAASAPVEIPSRCSIPATPGSPIPADGGVLSRPDRPIEWSNGISLGAKNGPAAWEPDGAACGKVLDINGLYNSGVSSWDGSSFPGVQFRALDGVLRINRRLQGDPIIVEAGTGTYSSGPLEMIFNPPASCVSMSEYDELEYDEDWGVTAYDSQGAVIAEFTNRALVRKVSLRAPGIARVVLKQDEDGDAALYDISFESVCSPTYEVKLGDSPDTLSTVATGLTASNFQPSGLNVNQNYYWQVITTTDGGTTAGPVWSFHTKPEIVVHDDAYTVAEDSTASVFDVTANDEHEVPLSIASVTQPDEGKITARGAYIGYLPPANFNGTTTFTYTTQDGGAWSTITGNVVVTDEPRNDPPVVVQPIADIVVAQNSPPQGLNLSSVFFDRDGDPLTYSLVQNSNPALVSVVLNGPVASLRYAPSLFGDADLRFRATDPSAAFAETIVRVKIGAAAAPPEVTLQPLSQTVNFGDTATFTCAGKSPTVLTYQWFREGVALVDSFKISGAQTASLSVLRCSNVEEGRYACRISNGASYVDTNAVPLVVRDPVIVTEPKDVRVSAGADATLEVVARGSGALGFQWYIGAVPLFEGSKYSGTQTSQLVVHKVTDDPNKPDVQLYHCEVHGTDATPAVSKGAWIFVEDPTITEHPASQQVRPGATVDFNLTAVGTPPLLYRWKKDGAYLYESARISGTRTPQLHIDNATTADSGAYVCTVVGQHIADSNAAQLAVLALPVITGVTLTPADGNVPYQGNFTIQLHYTGTLDTATVQWMHLGVPVVNGPHISGSQGPQLVVTQAGKGDTGGYHCVVTDALGSLYSPHVRVRVGVTFSTDLADALVENGAPLDWATATTGGEGPVTYAWFRKVGNTFQPVPDTGLITGVDSPTLHINAVLPADAGVYQVHATDGADTAISRSARLVVAAEVPGLSGIALLVLSAALAGTGAARFRRAKG